MLDGEPLVLSAYHQKCVLVLCILECREGKDARRQRDALTLLGLRVDQVEDPSDHDHGSQHSDTHQSEQSDGPLEVSLPLRAFQSAP